MHLVTYMQINAQEAELFNIQSIKKWKCIIYMVIYLEIGRVYHLAMCIMYGVANWQEGPP